MSTSIKLNTKEFATMLSKASKCSLRGSVDVLAELVEIKLKNGVLSLRTTDTRNTLLLRKSGVQGEDFNAVIGIGVFDKIVSKTTKDEVELVITDSYVELKGNGTYKFERAIEGGSPVEFEPINLITDPDMRVEFKLADLKDVIKYNGDFIGSPFVDPTISGYFFSDSAITTNGYNACFFKNKLFDAPIMLYESTFNMLNEFEGESVVFLKKGTDIQFYNASALLCSRLHQEIDEFPSDQLSKYLEGVHPSSVVISVKEAIDTLDRVMLFVASKAANGNSDAIMTFEPDGNIVITDDKGRVNESISYKNPNNFKPFSCCISVPDLMSMLNIDISDEVVFNFGVDDSVRIDVGDITRVLALSDSNDATVEFDDSIDSDISPDTEIGDIDAGIESSNDFGGSLDDINWG